jgi:hypothetical protein
MYAETRGTAAAIEKRKHQQKIRDDARAKVEERESIPLVAAE